MNIESPKDKQKLLNDVLGDEAFAGFDDGLKGRALGEFRRARFIRRARAVSVMALAAAGLGSFWLLSWQHPAGGNLSSNDVAELGTMTTDAETGGPKPFTARIINEEQLLAVFPKDSCFIAEVDGKKTLVFRDPQVRKQYFER
jgi:hypothetical protein